MYLHVCILIIFCVILFLFLIILEKCYWIKSYVDINVSVVHNVSF